MLHQIKGHFAWRLGDRVITTAWSRFNSQPHRTRCCVLG